MDKPVLGAAMVKAFHCMMAQAQPEYREAQKVPLLHDPETGSSLRCVIVQTIRCQCRNKNSAGFWGLVRSY